MTEIIELTYIHREEKREKETIDEITLGILYDRLTNPPVQSTEPIVYKFKVDKRDERIVKPRDLEYSKKTITANYQNKMNSEELLAKYSDPNFVFQDQSSFIEREGDWVTILNECFQKKHGAPNTIISTKSTDISKPGYNFLLGCNGQQIAEGFIEGDFKEKDAKKFFCQRYVKLMFPKVAAQAEMIFSGKMKEERQKSMVDADDRKRRDQEEQALREKTKQDMLQQAENKPQVKLDLLEKMKLAKANNKSPNASETSSTTPTPTIRPQPAVPTSQPQPQVETVTTAEDEAEERRRIDEERQKKKALLAQLQAAKPTVDTSMASTQQSTNGQSIQAGEEECEVPLSSKGIPLGHLYFPNPSALTGYVLMLSSMPYRPDVVELTGNRRYSLFNSTLSERSKGRYELVQNTLGGETEVKVVEINKDGEEIADVVLCVGKSWSRIWMK